jgi:N-acetylmuramoyl-L-alanine amidase
MIRPYFLRFLFLLFFLGVARPVAASGKDAIVVHHTWSLWGTVPDITEWHQARGWRTVGYQKVITNAQPRYLDSLLGTKRPGWDGRVFNARMPETSVGAHTREGHMNTRSIGVCLVGNFDLGPPSRNQWTSLVTTCVTLCQRYRIDTSRIFYHRDWAIGRDGKPYKSCPGSLFPQRSVLRHTVGNQLRYLRQQNLRRQKHRR